VPDDRVRSVELHKRVGVVNLGELVVVGLTADLARLRADDDASMD